MSAVRASRYVQAVTDRRLIVVALSASLASFAAAVYTAVRVS